MNRFDPDSLVTLLVLGLILLAFYWRPRWKPSTTAHGTAGWATDWALKRARMFLPGLVIGRSVESGKLISLPKGNVHTAIFAPTGAGKGVSFLIPTLLTYRGGSVIVCDLKGDLFRQTAHVRRALGQKVYRLDPFGGAGDKWNPLSLIGDDESCIEDSRPLAEALVVRGEEKESHWNDQSANVITAMLALVLTVCAGKERSLGGIRDLLTSPGAFDNCASALIKLGGVYARLGGVLMALEDKEKAGVLSTVHRHTTFADSPAILGATSESTFDMREILDGNTTVYLILPPHQMLAQSRWLRLVIASIIRLIGKECRGREILMLLDEAGQLGHMPSIEQGLTLMRSYGLKMQFYFQSIGQLKEVFKEKDAVLLDNTDQIYFGINSLETAERVSKMLGSYTRAVENYSENESRSWQEAGLENPGVNVSRNSGVSVSVHARALLDVSEVLGLSPDAVIAFIKGVGSPTICKRCKWFQEPALVKRQKAR